MIRTALWLLVPKGFSLLPGSCLVAALTTSSPRAPARCYPAPSRPLSFCTTTYLGSQCLHWKVYETLKDYVLSELLIRAETGSLHKVTLFLVSTDVLGQLHCTTNPAQNQLQCHPTKAEPIGPSSRLFWKYTPPSFIFFFFLRAC